jgi:hypothetical protein
MRPIRLDATTADRLLSGELAPEDAPPGYAGVAQLLDAAGAGLGAQGSVREGANLVAMQAAAVGRLAWAPAAQEKRVISKVLPIRTAVVAAAVLLGGGTAAAATGSLPAGVQNAASTVLAKIGISVPGPNNSGHDHPGTGGKSAGHAHHGKGPNAHATYGLCTAAEAHADSGHTPNPHATVFPSTTTCTSVTHPGQGSGNSSKPQDTPTTATEGPSGPPSSTPQGPQNSGRSHGRA